MPVDDFLASMGLMCASLGWDCANCHVNAGTREVDWAADPPAKIMARRMVRMVDAINRDHFGGRQVVSCFTCHHTRDRPLPTPTMEHAYGAPALYADDLLAGVPGAPPAATILHRYVEALGGARAHQLPRHGDERRVRRVRGGGSVRIWAQAPDRRSTIIEYRDAPGGARLRPRRLPAAARRARAGARSRGGCGAERSGRGGVLPGCLLAGADGQADCRMRAGLPSDRQQGRAGDPGQHSGEDGNLARGMGHARSERAGGRGDGGYCPRRGWRRPMRVGARWTNGPRRPRCWPGSRRRRCRAGSCSGRGPAPGSVAAAPPWPPSPTLQGSGRVRRATTASISMPRSAWPAGQRDRLEPVCRYALRPTWSDSGNPSAPTRIRLLKTPGMRRELGTPARGERSLGGVHPPELWVRCPRMPPVWRAPAAHCGDRRPRDGPPGPPVRRAPRRTAVGCGAAHSLRRILS